MITLTSVRCFHSPLSSISSTMCVYRTKVLSFSLKSKPNCVHSSIPSFNPQLYHQHRHHLSSLSSSLSLLSFHHPSSNQMYSKRYLSNWLDKTTKTTTEGGLSRGIHASATRLRANKREQGGEQGEQGGEKGEQREKGEGNESERKGRKGGEQLQTQLLNEQRNEQEEELKLKPNNETSKKIVSVIIGPTAVGKTDLAVQLVNPPDNNNNQDNVKYLISADSVQVYKGIPIGSNKMTEKEEVS